MKFFGWFVKWRMAKFALNYLDHLYVNQNKTGVYFSKVRCCSMLKIIYFFLHNAMCVIYGHLGDSTAH